LNPQIDSAKLSFFLHKQNLFVFCQKSNINESNGIFGFVWKSRR